MTAERKRGGANYRRRCRLCRHLFEPYEAGYAVVHGPGGHVGKIEWWWCTKCRSLIEAAIEAIMRKADRLRDESAAVLREAEALREKLS